MRQVPVAARPAVTGRAISCAENFGVYWMNVLKGVAGVPRQLSRLGKQSLTFKGLLVAAVTAVAIWISLDYFYQRDVHRLVADMESALYIAPSGESGIHYAARVDADQVNALGEQFLFSLREQRTLVLIVLTTLFCVAFMWFGARVKRIHHLLESYAQRLGFHMPLNREGDSISRLANRVARISEEMIAEATALEYQARHDNLTNLPNRSLFMERLETELQASRDDDELFSLFIMDLDQFKEVNDTLGHHVGDRLLQEVSRRLTSVLKNTDMVARLGGDEFAVLLPGADAERSRTVCLQIIAALDRPIKVENLCLRAALSIGVALCPEHGQDANLLMRCADVAMYEAKRKHKGFSFYTADNDDHSISRLGLSGELQRRHNRQPAHTGISANGGCKKRAYILCGSTGALAAPGVRHDSARGVYSFGGTDRCHSAADLVGYRKGA